MYSFSDTVYLLVVLLTVSFWLLLKQWLLNIISSYLLMMYRDGIDSFFYEPYISLNLILILLLENDSLFFKTWPKFHRVSRRSR